MPILHETLKSFNKTEVIYLFENFIKEIDKHQDQLEIYETLIYLPDKLLRALAKEN